MWQSDEFDQSRLVNLVLGAEKVVVQEETSFLATISPFFRAMFYSGFAEANMESIELPECDGTMIKFILEKLHEAKNENTSIDDKIAKIISPALFTTLSFLAISSNLEKFAFRNMRLIEIEDYNTLAKQTGNQALAKAVELRTLGLFSAYRQSEEFKKMTIEQLVAYLKHPLLEYEKEMEVLEAVLIWLDFDYNDRAKHLEKALSCVNWNIIEKIKAEVLLNYTNLRDNYSPFWDIFFISNLIKTYNTINVPEADLCIPDYYNLAEDLIEESKKRPEKKYFISVPFSYRLVPKGRLKYGVCIYDKENKVFHDQVFLLPNDEGEILNNDLRYVNVLYFDFHIYSFMRPANTNYKLAEGYYIEKHSLWEHQQSQWTPIQIYGAGHKNRRRLMDRDSLKHSPLFGPYTLDIPFFCGGDSMPLPEVTKDGVNVSITIAETVKLNLLTETIQRWEPDELPNTRTHFQLSLINRNEGIPISPLDIFRGQIDVDFVEKVQYLAASKVGQTILDFVVSDKYIQLVNPLWFTKFP